MKHRFIPVALVTAIIGSSLPFAGCAPKKKTVAQYTLDSATYHNLKQKDIVIDSTIRFFLLRVDSPEITIERLDSPRLRIRAHSRRISAANSAASASTALIESDVTNDFVVRNRSDTHSESKPATTRATHWWLLAAAGVLGIMYWINRTKALRSKLIFR